MQKLTGNDESSLTEDVGDGSLLKETFRWISLYDKCSLFGWGLGDGLGLLRGLELGLGDLEIIKVLLWFIVVVAVNVRNKQTAVICFSLCTQ